MQHLRWLSTPLLIALLAACGGPTNQSQTPPTTSSFDPQVALPGETVTIAGSNLGESGKVTIGGVEAAVVSWTGTQVVAVIPSGAPSGWQEIVVTNANGQSQLDSLFVGAEFSGAAADLQEFLLALPAGSAVLLQAEAYDVSSAAGEFLIDNRSLYGRGADATTLDLDGDIAGVLADFGRTVRIADLSMEDGDLMVLHGSADRYLATSGLAALNQAFATGAGNVSHLSRLAPEALEPASGPVPVMEFSNFEFRGGGAGGFSTAPFLPYPILDIRVSDAKVELGDMGLHVFTLGSLDLNGATIQAELILLGAIGEALHIEASTLVGRRALLLGADSGLTVNDSTLRATDGHMELLGALLTEISNGEVITGGPITVTESSLEAFDADLTDGTDYGDLTIFTQFAPITVRDNRLLRSHRYLEVWTAGSGMGEGSVTVTGNADVRSGVFREESPTNPRQGEVVIGAFGGGVPDLMTIEDNSLTATHLVGIRLGVPALTDSGPSDLVMRRNDITAGDGEGDGEFLIVGEAEGRFELTSNTITLDARSFIDVDLGGAPAQILSNEFSVLGAWPRVEFTLKEGSCQVGENTFGLETDDPLVGEEFRLHCAAGDPLIDAHSFEGNQLTFSDAYADLSLGFEGGKASISENVLSSASWFEMTLNDTTAEVSGNAFTGLNYALHVAGDSGADLTLHDNTVQLVEVGRAGLFIEDLAVATVTDNTFTNVGSPNPLAQALEVATYLGSPMKVTATGNTFTNFGRALYLYDDGAGTTDFDVRINHNVFDFPMNAVGQVATLEGIKDVIDARHNVWGENTDDATVESYVDEGSAGGSVLIDPIEQP